MSSPIRVLRCLLIVMCIYSVSAFAQKADKKNQQAVSDTAKSGGDKIRILCVDPLSDTILKAKQTIVLHKSGFPLQIRDQHGDSLFTEPIHLHVVSGATHKDIRFTSNEIIYRQRDKRKANWESTSSSPALSMKVSGTLEKQKQLELVVTFTALEDTQLDDIKLHLPYSIQWASMLEGLGRQHGAQTDTLRWQWQDHPGTKEATVWQGNSDGGLQLQLPESWQQTDKAGLWIGIKGKSMLLENNSGAQHFNVGETKTYRFRLLIANKKAAAD